jgi:glycosyltransferase involved in cell wall biosynthesis
MGGVETHCEALYPRLAAKGHAVTLFARRGYTRSDSPYSYEGVRVVPVWAPRKKSLEAVAHTMLGVLMAAAKKDGFDLLHVHAIGPSLMVPLARSLGLRVVMTHHGPDYDRDKWGPFAKWALRLGERLGCTYSDSVITVSRHIRGSVKELYGRDGNYIPNGVPVPEIIKPGESLARFGLEPGRYVLTVGRFVPEKGFHDLMSAFKGVDTGWKLVIAGRADHEDSYSRRIAGMAGADSRVALTGFIKGRELGEIYSNAGLFVLPSYHEGLPIALLEAMSYGLPVLASDIPANMELLGACEPFPAGDVGVLSDRLRCFIESPERDADNREKVAREYGWDRVAEDTEAVYMRTLAA